MLILALDSAANGCSACVWEDGRIVAEANERMQRGQDQRLMPLILEVVRNAGARFALFDRIAVTRGPGSFTGLRIGLAAARGIGLASGKPVIGIDRFSIYHEQVNPTERSCLVVLDSKRKDLFCRHYPATGPAGPMSMMTAGEIARFLETAPDTILAGDTALESLGIAKPREADEAGLASLLASRAPLGDPAFLPRPLYIRPPDVTVKDVTRKDGTLQQDAGLIPATLAMAGPLAEIHGAAFGPRAWGPDQIAGSLALKTTQGWAALEGARPVGFILCQILKDRSEILTLAVAPAAQRRGVGSKLLHKAFAVARDFGSDTLCLEVAGDNLEARALYEQCGFALKGGRPHYYPSATPGGPPVDAVIYERSLSEQWLHKG